MKKQLSKIALAVIFAMAVTLIAPAAQVAEAASRKFTYAEQITGEKVTVLAMEPGEEVDLKFNGVSNWKTYTYTWTSSNQNVAVVDSNGKITALKTGVTTIKLSVAGGEHDYTAESDVIVHVGAKQEAGIGVAGSNEEIKSLTMKLGEKKTLQAVGLMDNIAGRYTCEWSSTDTSVAKINEKGEITTVAPGLSVIQLTVTKAITGKKFETTPIALLVQGEGAAAPTVKPVATPTTKPAATPTTAPSVPTATPMATPVATPTTAPVGTNVPYTVKLVSERSIEVTFAEKVAWKLEDVKLEMVYKAGSQIGYTPWQVADISWDVTGTKMTIDAAVNFMNNQQYRVSFGTADTGKIFNVQLGAPNRIEISYNCMGQENKAYAYDDALGLDVPVNLTYRLFYGNIDVTDTYKNRGNGVIFEIVNENYINDISLNGEVLNFYQANTSAVVRATFEFQNDSGKDIKLTATENIRASKLPQYSVLGVVNWALIDTRNVTAPVEWKSTLEVIANSEAAMSAKVVAMLADSYGNYFVTDERAVDTAKKIYSVNDANQLFAQMGYVVEFRAANPNVIYIGDDGSMYAYQQTTTDVVAKVISNNANGVAVGRDIGACKINVRAESKLTSITADKTSVTLATTALPGYEDRFCKTSVKILLKDQYGNEWTGDKSLNVSCTIKNINDALDGSSSAPAYIDTDGTTLHINALAIKAIASNSTGNINFKVTEANTNKTVNITVKLQKPVESNGSITVNNWSLGLENSQITLGEMDKDAVTQSADIEVYRTSGSNIKVGLYDNLHILETTNFNFTNTNCSEGEVYILVKGPDGKVVPQADNDSALGVYLDNAANCVKVNVSAPMASGSLYLESLKPGKYTVTATKIISTSNGTYARTETRSTTFTVTDNTKNVTFRSVKNGETSLSVYGTNDQNGAKAIVESTLTFNLGDEHWTTMNANMISNVEYKLMNNGDLIIQKVEFAVPVNESEAYSMSYKKECVVNQVIKTGVN